MTARHVEWKAAGLLLWLTVGVIIGSALAGGGLR